MTKIIFITLIVSSMLAANLSAQTDTTKSVDLLRELSINDSTMPLLPKHIMITQRLLWGHKGLMRNFTYFKLSPAERQRELKIRRTMLVTHQVTGFVTLGGMIAEGIVGAKLYNGRKDLIDVHGSIGAFVNVAFFTTAGLALLAPPKMINERKGYSSIKLHKALAVLSLSSMIATDILASQLEGNPSLKPYHRAAAYTAFASFTAQIIVIKF